MPNEFVKLECRGEATYVTLCQPAKGNALSDAMVRSLDEAVESLSRSGTRMAVFQGDGRHFCTGFDLSDVESQSDGDLLLRFVAVELLLQKVFALPMLTVAVGSGRVFGAGADLFAACHRRIALTTSSYSFPGAKFGLVLGTRRLASRVGRSQAQSIILSGRALSGNEAMDIGLATDLVEEASLEDKLASISEMAVTLELITVSHLNGVLLDRDDNGDLANLVRSASRPNLKERIIAYTRKVQASRKAKAIG